MVVTNGRGQVVGTESWVNAKRRVWGWRVYLHAPEPVEAQALRDAVQSLVAGRTLQDIANAWDKRSDIHTVHGGRWHAQVVEKLVRRRTNTRGPEPLLSHTMFEAVVKHLDSPARVPSQQPATPLSPRYSSRAYGTWVTPAAICCGLCGCPVSRYGNDRGGQPAFGCTRFHRASKNTRPERGQQHPTLLGDGIETEVILRTIAAWAHDRAVPVESAANDFRDLSLGQARALARRYVRGVLMPQPRGRGRVEWSRP